MEDSTVPSPRLGELFRDARAIKHLSLEDVEEQTKIRLKHLRAIEEGHFHELPFDVFAIGFVRRYAQAVDVDPAFAVSLFREERAKSRHPHKRSVTFSPPQAKRRAPIVFSPRLVISLTIVLVVLLLFGYIWHEVRLFSSPPQLVIESPVANTSVAQSMVPVAGATGTTATVTINDESVPLDESGRFRQDVKLAPGMNSIEVRATNRLGKEATKTIYVFFEGAGDITPLTPDTMTPPL
jgi:cytoskeletal protein RodZ